MKYQEKAKEINEKLDRYKIILDYYGKEENIGRLNGTNIKYLNKIFADLFVMKKNKIGNKNEISSLLENVDSRLFKKEANK